jgi:hypothetical protein
MWKEVVVAYFKTLFRHLPGETEEEKNLSQDNHVGGRSSCGHRRNADVKAVPLHAAKELEGRGGIARTHSRPRH